MAFLGHPRIRRILTIPEAPCQVESPNEVLGNPPLGLSENLVLFQMPSRTDALPRHSHSAGPVCIPPGLASSTSAGGQASRLPPEPLGHLPIIPRGTGSGALEEICTPTALQHQRSPGNLLCLLLLLSKEVQDRTVPPPG